MTPVTLVMAYYENAGVWAEHAKRIRALAINLRELVHVIVVDDGSPKAPAVVQDLNGVALQIYRMRKDVRWNQDACRNIGVAHSETAWVLLTDIDHLVPVNTWNAVCLRDYNPQIIYRFARVSLPLLDPYKPHPNSWLMTKNKYDELGGYDERFAGYYGTDGDFRDRITKSKTPIVQLKDPLIRVPRQVIPDASTTTYLRKQPEDSEMIFKIKVARAQDPDWKPLRGTFEYDRVFP